MIAEKDRMTVENFSKLSKLYNVTLDPNYFILDSPRTVCPVGLLVLDHLKDFDLAYNIVNAVQCICFDLSSSDQTAAGIAEHFGFNPEYARGLDSGVREKSENRPGTDDHEVCADFYIGYADGLAILREF